MRRSAAAVSPSWRATMPKVAKRAARSSSWWHRPRTTRDKPTMSMTCCAARWRVSRSRTRSAKSRSPPAGRAIAFVLFTVSTGERARALRDLAARPAGGERHFADRVLDRDTRQRAAQQVIDIVGLSLVVRGRRHHDDDLAARFATFGIVARQLGETAAADLLMQLGQFAADRGRELTKLHE